MFQHYLSRGIRGHRVFPLCCYVLCLNNIRKNFLDINLFNQKKWRGRFETEKVFSSVYVTIIGLIVLVLNQVRYYSIHYWYNVLTTLMTETQCHQPKSILRIYTCIIISYKMTVSEAHTNHDFIQRLKIQRFPCISSCLEQLFTNKENFSFITIFVWRS